MITVEKKYASKIEKYIKHHFQSLDAKSNVDLIIFQDEEEPIDVLRMVQSRIYTDVIVMEGNALFDVPLDQILDTHRLASGSITTLLKEFDMKKGGKGAKMADVDTQDIFGISSWTPEQKRLGVDGMY